MPNQGLIVSVIVPVYNSSRVITECIRALEQQSFPRNQYEIIIVDDGSTDNTIEVVRSFSGVRYISIKHGGPAAARNAGARIATGEIIAFTDSDCVPTPEWLEKILEPFTNKDVVGAKGTYRSSQTQIVSRFVQLEYQYKYQRMIRLSSIDFIDTYSAAYRRKIFLENGGFDTSFTLPSVEDQELSFRLSQKGYLMVFVPRAEVYHQHDKNLSEYWKRKFGIGYWKAYMLRWLPQKTMSDTHTSPSQRFQIISLWVATVSLLIGIFIPPLFLIGIGFLIAFFITGMQFWIYVLKKDSHLGFAFPLILSVRAGALGAGLMWGLLYPPKKWRHYTPSFSIGAFFMKRIVDIIGSFLGLTLSLPILFIAGIAIKVNTPGPIFFTQMRAGENGKPFKMIKLRTMVNGAEKQLEEVIGMNHLNGPVYKIPQDPRITKVGQFLRRWSIDELPQFWNVLQGHMSLVGPRPEELWVVERYNDEQRQRLAIKPGMTGPMQINGRGNLDFDERLKLEMDYTNNYSLSKDFSIMIRTIAVVFNGHGAF